MQKAEKSAHFFLESEEKSVSVTYRYYNGINMKDYTGLVGRPTKKKQMGHF